MSILDELSSSVGDRTENSNRAVAQKVEADPILLSEIAAGLASPNLKMVGDCAEVLTMVSEKRPEVVAPFIDRVIPLLQSKNKRVRWESMHTLVFLARRAAATIAPLLPQLAAAIAQDDSVIVREYAIQVLGEYSITSAAAAQGAFPILLKSLEVWSGDHVATALEGLAKAAEADPALMSEVIETAQKYRDAKKSKVQKVARSILRRLSPK